MQYFAVLVEKQDGKGFQNDTFFYKPDLGSLFEVQIKTNFFEIVVFFYILLHILLILFSVPPVGDMVELCCQ